MKKYFYFLAVLVIVVVSSCKQDQYYLFNDEARLQFGPAMDRIYQTSFNLADTLKPYTFYYEEAAVVQDTVFFDLYTIGDVVDYDRPFTLVQEEVPGADNAVPGTDYKAFDHPEINAHYVIKADSVHAFVPIVLLRDASLKENTKMLKFKIIANEHFKTGEPSNLWRKVTVTDRLSRPGAWDARAEQYYFGAYSVTKHEFMINATGEKWDEDFITTILFDYALLQFWQGVLEASLVDYNNAHPNAPLTDENGEVVIFP